MVFRESTTFKIRSERAVILLLCVAAALRVFIFSAAFPFFSNIDEDLHFDLIARYSRGEIPRSFKRLDEETLGWIVPYASPEFLFSPDQFPNVKFPAPLWKQSGPTVEPEIASTKAAWSSQLNFESSQPPLYYIIASFWWWIGKHIGLVGIQGLYWIRFLNVLMVAIVVCLGYLIARAIAPDRTDLCIGVPLLLAFITQNVFYAMNNDVLSPICMEVLFLCVLWWLRAEAVSVWLGTLTGLTIAAAYLTKLSNLPMILAALAVIVAAVIRRKSRTGLLALAALISFATIPTASWMAWLKFQFGDVTGSAAKIAFLDWTRKPFAAWWQHPIFTPRGFWTFWSDLIANFWRGEVSWHGHPVNWGFADGLFAVSSLILLASAIIGVARRAALSTFQQRAIGTAILMFLAGVAFLALLSIQFDFGSCVNPSQAHPYFTSGRLLSGALIPFALFYVYGIAFLLRRIKSALPLIILGVIVLFATASEIVINRVVFASEHNWFHR